MPSAEALIAAAGGSIHEHRKATRKMRWWYESLADFMIANPKATQNDMAAHFGRAVSTISTIVNTDAFRAYMRARRDEHQSILDQTVRGKLLNLTERTLDTMLEVVNKKRDSLPLEQLRSTTDMALKALGYTSEKPQVVVNNTQTGPQTVVVPVSLSDLQEAQMALRASQQKPMIDVTPPPGPVREARQTGPDTVEVVSDGPTR